VVFTAKVVSGSSRTDIVGQFDGMIKFKVSAVPEKGKANQSLIKFLARRLGVRKRAISIISGLTNPVKCVQISGVSPETLIEELNLNE
jgi:uncharacterized protein (TIGR00251 family)